MTTTIIIHSFDPIPDHSMVGGFDWGIEGTESEAKVRASFALDSDVDHQDYLPSHIHRLVRQELEGERDKDAITDLIDSHLDMIESGALDNTTALIAKHDPTEAEKGATV
jgi:hypothetical protein